ncbi:MAG: relaxase [Firmicutes bacterium HGW-Firmicutes-7]|nr:MAG: relaxase [Firmicutes bacterium HGW-Firmicutes-7]
MATIEFINRKNGRKNATQTKHSLKRSLTYIANEEKTEVEYDVMGSLMQSNKGLEAINYITNDKKTSVNLITGINCSPESAYDEMMVTKGIYRKDEGRQFIHFVHSYHPNEKVSPEILHKISLELLKHKRFEGFEILTATHVDKSHIHTHFVLNSVNLETGIKWRQSKKELGELIEYSNKLCYEYGLKHSFIELNKDKVKSKNSGEYRAQKEGRSYKHETFLSAKECRKISKSKEEFIQNMKTLGYGVRWEDSRKDITFTTPTGRKINNDKLYPVEHFTKEGLIKQFELNKQFQKTSNKEFTKEEQAFENKKELVLQATRMMSSNPKLKNNKDYPLTYHEGQALKEKRLQKAKGEGLDWDRER